MMYVLGMDEAGYGPNLGPLVVAASLWRVETNLQQLPDLYSLLEAAVCSVPDSSGRLAIADSKLLYQSGKSLAALEHGVLAALCLLDRSPATWQTCWSAASHSECCTLPWHTGYECDLPREVEPQSIATTCNRLRECFRRTKIELVDYRASVVHPAEFNEGCDRLGTKGALLSQTTLSLARSLLAPCEDGPLAIVCDKHGGRNNYTALVWDQLASYETNESSGMPVQVLRESREESLYRWQGAKHPREIRFVSKGERFLPAALASMMAKYLRELAMLAFNDFWIARIPNLIPTAGYPSDAKRYRQAIEPHCVALQLEPRAWWRER